MVSHSDPSLFNNEFGERFFVFSFSLQAVHVFLNPSFHSFRQFFQASLSNVPPEDRQTNSTHFARPGNSAASDPTATPGPSMASATRPNVTRALETER